MMYGIGKPPRLQQKSGSVPGFFRLACLLDRRVIPLGSRILVQDGLRRVGDPFRIGHLLVVGLANASMAQEGQPLPWQGHDDDVLVGVRVFFLPLQCRACFSDTVARKLTLWVILVFGEGRRSFPSVPRFVDPVVGPAPAGL
jgi:hypothetical protein